MLDAAEDPQEEVTEDAVAETLDEDAEGVALDVALPTMFPWSSTSATAEKSVLVPNTALNASA